MQVYKCPVLTTFAMPALREVGEELRVAICPLAQVSFPELRDVELPERPYFIKVALAPADGGHQSIDWGANAFDEKREIVVRAPAAGRMKVHWLVEHRGGSSSTATMANIEPEQFVEILDTDGEQVVEVTLTDDQVQEIVARLK